MSLFLLTLQNVQQRRLLRRLAFSVFVFALSPLLCHAAGTVFSTGFESPYVLGPLQGQPSGSPAWVTAGSGTSTASVENTVVNSGTQAVQVVKAGAANSDRRWAVPVSGYPTQRYVLVDWDMRVSPSSILTGSGTGFGPF